MVDASDQANSEYEYDWQNPNLKKFDFGRMLKRSVKGALYCGKVFWLQLLLFFALPMFLVSLWPMLLPDGAYGEILSGGDYSSLKEIFTPVTSVVIAVIYLTFIFAYTVLYIALSHNVFGFYNEVELSFKESFKRGTARFWGTVGAMILFSLGVMLGFVLLVVPGVILWLGWYLIGPILAVEDKGVTASLSRAWKLSKGSKRWILLFLIIVILMSAIVSIAFSLFAMPFGTQATALVDGGSTIFWIINAVGATGSQLFVFLLTVAGVTSIYYEILDVKEDVSQNKLSSVFD